MAFYKSKSYSRARPTAKRWSPKRKTTVSKTFAASPAGKHRKLAVNAFALARKARAAGNTKHYWRMVGFGKRALALSRAEVRMFKKGAMLRAKAFAAHRRARSPAYR